MHSESIPAHKLLLMDLQRDVLELEGIVNAHNVNRVSLADILAYLIYL